MANEEAYEALCKKVEAVDADAAAYMRSEEARALWDFQALEDLKACFTWSYTPQGFEYWDKIHDAIGGTW